MTEIYDELTNDERAFLEAHHFDRATFERLRAGYLEGELSQASNRIAGEVEPPRAEDIVSTRGLSEEDRVAALAAGVHAIDAGHVAHVVLNGGMATRFGGVVKGVVEATEGYSFLGLKLLDANRWNGTVPLILMNSSATARKTDEHLEANDYFGADRDRVWEFEQNVSVRLTPDGDIVRDNGGASFYGPGHGDLPSAINRGVLERFREEGGRYIFMSNVDNVLATIDPLIIGLHVLASEEGVEMTVEAAPRYEGDKGGMPARVDGRLQVVEAFRFPDGFDDSTIPVFNTNTFIFDAEALQRPFDLTWFVVEKEADGQKVVQFERLAGELSAFLNCQFLQIEREGDASRFLPIKKPEDLDRARDYLRDVMEERGVLR